MVGLVVAVLAVAVAVAIGIDAGKKLVANEKDGIVVGGHLEHEGVVFAGL